MRPARCVRHPQVSKFEELLPLMWGEIGCFRRMGTVALNKSMSDRRFVALQNRTGRRWGLEDLSMLTPLLEQRVSRHMHSTVPPTCLGMCRQHASHNAANMPRHVPPHALCPLYLTQYTSSACTLHSVR